MRWFDEYLGLLAAASLFGAAVLWAAGTPVAAQVAFLGLSAASLAIMAWRVVRTPRVLLVGEPPGRPRYRLREALDDAGYGLRVCAGPEERPCPVLQGKPCPVRGRPRAALILRRPGDRGPLPPCGEALGVRIGTVEGNETPSWLAA